MAGLLVSPMHAGHWHWLFSHHQGKMKVQLNPAYPVPFCISENNRSAFQQGLHLHFVHGICKQTSQTCCSGEPGLARLQLCLSHVEVWIPQQCHVWLQSPHWQSPNPSKTKTPHPWAGR